MREEEEEKKMMKQQKKKKLVKPGREFTRSILCAGTLERPTNQPHPP